MLRYRFLRFLHIRHILLKGVVPSFEMVVSMVAYGVTGSYHLGKNLRMFVYILAHHEERSLHAVLSQYIQHFRRHLRYRTVIESQIDRFTRTKHSVRVKGMSYIS